MVNKLKKYFTDDKRRIGAFVVWFLIVIYAIICLFTSVKTAYASELVDNGSWTYEDREITLNDAVRMIAHKFGIITSNVELEDNDKLEDWSIFDRYKRVQNIELKDYINKYCQAKTLDTKRIIRYDIQGDKNG